MLGRVLVLVGAMFVGCGGRVVVDGTSGGMGGAASDAGAAMDAGADSDAADAADAADAPVPPVPICAGSSSECVEDAGFWYGASLITCNPVYFVGPWNLLLEREAGTQFEVVQSQAVQEPGFGYTFYDLSGTPGLEYTYRVCVVDDAGTRCDAPFMTNGPVDCNCPPLTCEFFQACNTKIDNGCGGVYTCGECSSGAPCTNGSCCPPGMGGNGNGSCVCMPDGKCPPGAWDVTTCRCMPGAG
jgi:hypothetical protein